MKSTIDHMSDGPAKVLPNFQSRETRLDMGRERSELGAKSPSCFRMD